MSVLTETETPRGWVFAVDVAHEDAPAPPARHELRLAFVDYEYWSHGMRSPSSVAEAVCRALLDLRPDLAWPEAFDASTARRWARDMDLRVREVL